jgi:hypothetical protein
MRQAATRPASSALSDRGTSKDPGREQNKSLEKLEDPVDGDADQAERKKEQPDDRVEKEGDNRQGPAEDEQDEPKEEFCHTRILPSEITGQSEKSYIDIVSLTTFTIFSTMFRYCS